MTGPYTECQIRLHRDALNTPWGFRLQGGTDFKAPLTVQRVFVGSPADGDINRGDVIVAIDNYDTHSFSHKQAQDIIKNAGGSLSLRIRRGAGLSTINKPVTFTPPALGPLSQPSQYRSRPLDSVAPKPTPPIGAFSPKSPTSPGMQSYGVDYNRQLQPQYGHPAGPGQNAMLNKVKDSLDENLWTPDDCQDPEYEKKSIGEIQRMFSNSGLRQQAAYGQPSYQPRAKPWRKPNQDGAALKDPGWAPIPKTQWSSVPQPAPEHEIINRPQQAPLDPVYRTEQMRHQDLARPAWKGSLRGSGGPKPWEINAGESLVPGGVEAHVPRGPSDVPKQAPQSQTFRPQQQQQQQRQQQQQPPQRQQQQHSSNIHGQVHSPRVQNVHYAPGQSPQYQQQQGGQSDTAAVVHQQYNSPLGLYSKANVKAVLDGQTAGKPGQGTMQVTGGDEKKQFNPEQSDVYRLLQEEEKQRRGGGQSARYQEHARGQEMQYHGYMDHTHQSPKMNALEQYVMDDGTSDF